MSIGPSKGILIVINNVAPGTISMGGDDTSVTIPSAMVSLEDGNAIVAQLGKGVNGTLQPAPATDGYNVKPGIQHINDVIVRNNDGVSEVFFAMLYTYLSSLRIY